MLYLMRCEVQLACLASGAVVANDRRQHWTLITVPATAMGTSVTTIISGDSGTGEISSSTIPETIQSTEKQTAKSIRGTSSQYSSADIAVAGASAAPMA